jgi:hypothetical protein
MTAIAPIIFGCKGRTPSLRSIYASSKLVLVQFQILLARQLKGKVAIVQYGERA